MVLEVDVVGYYNGAALFGVALIGVALFGVVLNGVALIGVALFGGASFWRRLSLAWRSNWRGYLISRLKTIKKTN